LSSPSPVPHTIGEVVIVNKQRLSPLPLPSSDAILAVGIIVGCRHRWHHRLVLQFIHLNVAVINLLHLFDLVINEGSIVICGAAGGMSPSLE
jgi:hypothetical protein